MVVLVTYCRFGTQIIALPTRELKASFSHHVTDSSFDSFRPTFNYQLMKVARH